jgi:hypothetical protein
MNVNFTIHLLYPINFLLKIWSYSFYVTFLWFYYHVLVVQGGYIVIYTMWSQYILVRFTPSIILPVPPLPFLEKFQQISFFYLHIWIQNTFTTYTLPSPFPCAQPPPIGTCPWKKIYFSLLLLIIFLINCILIVQEHFTLVLPICIYRAFIKLVPSLPLLTHSLSTCFPNIRQLTV